MRLDGSGYRSPFIEGYASKQSAKAGDVLDFFISTQPAARFKMDIFRTGYYGGRGAWLMTELGPFDGKAQPVSEVGARSLLSQRMFLLSRMTPFAKPLVPMTRFLVGDFVDILEVLSAVFDITHDALLHDGEPDGGEYGCSILRANDCRRVHRIIWDCNRARCPVA